jgi:hypothetical protein
LKGKILGFGLVFSTLILCGCPGKVDPGNAQDSALGKTSKTWGLPMIRTVTAGFNGFPGEPNDAGPSNTTSPTKTNP